MSALEEARTPVILLTGFLGSGKTTVLNQLLQLPEMADTAVIINEFGEVGLDHLLVEQVSENLRLLQSGCLCCTVRGDLVDTLIDLYERRQHHTFPAFSRVIIETTGLADPTPVLQTFMIDPGVTSHYRLAQVVTLVDAVNGMRTLDMHTEALKQVTLADRLLLSKTDLTDPVTITKLEQRLADLNPGAEVRAILHGQVSEQDILSVVERQPIDLDAYLAQTENGYIQSSHRDGAVQSHCLVLDQPVEEARLAHWLELMATLRGENLLRIKGLVKVVEHPDQPTVVHGVQQIVHPLQQLPAWPSNDTRSRIVLIVMDIDYAEISRTFERFVGVRLPAFRPLNSLKQISPLQAPI
ncbi:MAG TPA: GTP-binding protein [Pseudomonas sp.]|nr:GTP-binding protein [Pseudomonas sp.]